MAGKIHRNRDTTLTAWFKLNEENQTARQYLYREISTHYRFDSKSRQWKLSKRRSHVLERIYSVRVQDTERYCLRLLLINLPRAQSFQHLLTVNGELYSTFKEAAFASNLLSDDSAWVHAMAEAAAFQMSGALRQFFVNICVHCAPTNARNLFDLNLPHFFEDHLHKEFGHLLPSS